MHSETIQINEEIYNSKRCGLKKNVKKDILKRENWEWCKTGFGKYLRKDVIMEVKYNDGNVLMET